MKLCTLLDAIRVAEGGSGSSSFFACKYPFGGRSLQAILKLQILTILSANLLSPVKLSLESPNFEIFHIQIVIY